MKHRLNLNIKNPNYGNVKYSVEYTISVSNQELTLDGAYPTPQEKWRGN